MNRDSLVLPFNSPNATLTEVGGRGVNLSLLTRASFPVPPGFLVTTTAYRAFIQANNLQKQIVDSPRNESDTTDKYSATIRQLFANRIIPPEVADAINVAYTNLAQKAGELPLAVRSSATAEDLPGASFAGQHDTYLNVRGEAALLDAVQRCWSSLWTAYTPHHPHRPGQGRSDASAKASETGTVAVVPERRHGAPSLLSGDSDEQTIFRHRRSVDGRVCGQPRQTLPGPVADPAP